MASSQNQSSRQGSNASRKVLITGVSKGLGRALALELATHGHTIIGCSRDQTKLDSLQEQLSKSSPIQHFLFTLDVVCKSLNPTVKNDESPQWYDIIHFEHKLSWLCFGLLLKASHQWR